MRRSANLGDIAKHGRTHVMNFKTTAIAAGLAAALGTGGALAQSYSQESPAPAQQMPYRHHGHHHGVLALISAEVAAGRISHKEGMLIERKIHEMKAERRAERQARYESRQGNIGNQGYEQGNNPPPPPPSQQPPR
jgi:hypothetical protein